MGIRLVQDGVVLADGSSAHPPPIAIAAGVLCFLSFVGSPVPVVYDWTLSAPPTDPGAVISSATSPGPTFLAEIDGGAYSATLVDEHGNTYVLDCAVPSVPIDPATGGIVQYVTTVASLRVTTGSSTNATVSVRCYATVGDGGGGVFCWTIGTPPADDGGINIVVSGVTTAWWVRQYAGPVRAEWFGAVGSGAGDMGPPLNSALVFLVSQHGGTLLLGAGKFRFTTPINGDNARNITIEGVGDCIGPASGDAVSTISYEANGSADAISLKHSNGFTLAKLAIEYTGTFSGTLVNIDGTNASPSSRFRLDRVRLSGNGVYTAAYLVTYANSYNGTFEKCTFDKCQQTFRGRAQAADFANNISYINCAWADAGAVIRQGSGVGDSNVFMSCSRGALFNGKVAEISCDFPVSGLTVSGEWVGDVFTGSAACFWWTFRGAGLVVSGGQYYGPGGSAIGLQPGVSGVSVHGNTFVDLSAAVDHPHLQDLVTFNAGTDVWTASVDHFLENGYAAVVETIGGTLPVGYSGTVTYWVVNTNRAAKTFQLSAAIGGAAVNGTTNGVGPLYVTGVLTNVHVTGNEQPAGALTNMYRPAAYTRGGEWQTPTVKAKLGTAWGGLQRSEPYAMRVSLTGPQSVASLATAVVLWDVVDLDWGGYYSAATGRFTAPITGWYVCRTIVAASPTTAGSTGAVLAYKNGALVVSRGTVLYADVGGRIVSSTLNDEVYLLAGDTIEIRYNNNDAVAAVNIGQDDALPYWSLRYVGN